MPDLPNYDSDLWRPLALSDVRQMLRNSWWFVHQFIRGGEQW